MIVYGDFERREDAADVKACVAKALRHAGRLPAGIDRHAALVGAFTRAAELVQGIADAEFGRRGRDLRSAPQSSGARLLLKMAEAIDLSWTNTRAEAADHGTLVLLLQEIHFDGLIKTRTGEGFAHYALYPESYLEAARSSGLAANSCVIGIRSIGIGLGALVAAALHAAPAISVRPVGHPFDRKIHADRDLLEEKVVDRSVAFAIVDEGPGLSGSSFASVARWLLEQGVETHRIHFFPSHEGQPGSSASPETRAIWDCVTHHPASRHDIVFHSRGLRHWVGEKIGPVDGDLRDLSCDRVMAAPVCPPEDGRFARRKLIAHAAGSRWLVKFAGLGDVGQRKFHDASRLAAAGFGPETVALCHGFIVQKWVEGRPLDESCVDRNAFLRRLGDYLAFRARRLGGSGPGASLQKLGEMAMHNAAQALGTEAAALLERRLASLDVLHDRVRPIRSDNRLHAWEWLITPGSILKLDGLDHCEGHDLIGCQDIAWDVAGAIVEHGLEHREVVALCRRVQAAGGATPDPDLIFGLLPCYLAFQLGLWATATPAGPRAKALANTYEESLVRCLRSDICGTPVRD
ncbi:hypothetical protein J8I29_24720 [Labrys sp. LIt4]|uniref:hypothetical protein n=1 Tax=Labrys sp. LIt4 TaxID=2821355 RepID=UPI001AE097A8|nr:hypothetical protein [Labrys sp. LIt4]MBP0582554.1 hypothetical protein [Labrys sp. LIt4]